MANVELSAAELELVTNAQFILTKNAIVQKVYALFGQLAEAYSLQANELPVFPDEVLKTPPKISKGENYEGLPWVMLDWPRLFKQEETFAIRCFFWWGNFCSITMQLKGKYREKLKVEGLGQKVEGAVRKVEGKRQEVGDGLLTAKGSKLKAQEDWFLCCNQDEWQHHFREDNYRPLSTFTQEEIEKLPFIKLAKKIPLQEWDNLYSFYTTAFSELLHMLQLTT